jgi:plastocyanin
LLGLTVFACGDDDSVLETTTTTLPSTTTTTVPSTTTTTAVAVEFSLIGGQPAAGFEDLPVNQARGFGLASGEVVAPAPTLTVGVGDEVSITLENVHPFEEQHNFVIVAEFEGGYSDALWEARIPALDVGETGTVTFTPDTAGTYFYVCAVAAHRFEGMAGEFVVEG